MRRSQLPKKVSGRQRDRPVYPRAVNKNLTRKVT
jgi:hypothetical protein